MKKGVRFVSRGKMKVIQRILDSLELMTPSEIEEVRQLLEKGFDNPASTGVREPVSPRPPTLVTVEKKCQSKES